jgi:hypothetical protein
LHGQRLGFVQAGKAPPSPEANEQSDGLDGDPDVALQAFHLTRDPVEAPRQCRLLSFAYDLLSLNERLLDLEALRKLPGIFRAREYQNQDLHSGEQEENHLECDGSDKSIFEGSESGG